MSDEFRGDTRLWIPGGSVTSRTFRLYARRVASGRIVPQQGSQLPPEGCTFCRNGRHTLEVPTRVFVVAAQTAFPDYRCSRCDGRSRSRVSLLRLLTGKIDLDARSGGGRPS